MALQTLNFDQVLDAVEALPPEDQTALLQSVWLTNADRQLPRTSSRVTKIMQRAILCVDQWSM
jgi:hypothetical protein